MLITRFLRNRLDTVRDRLEQDARDVRGEVMEAVARELGPLQKEFTDWREMLQAGVQERIGEIFEILRKIMPIAVVEIKGRRIAVVTRFDDVQEVLSRDDVFQVTYRDKMEKITAGNNFFLGMQNTPTYTRDVSNMRIVVRRDDLENRIAPFVKGTAEAIVDNAGGHIDFVKDLSRVVPTRWVGDYFGTPGPSEQELTDWATVMFQYLFLDLKNEPAVEQQALAAAAKARPYLDQTIAERKANPGPADDVVARCLALQSAGTPGMSDLDIRNNLIGLIIGAIPTTSKSAALALDVLLDRPEELAKAQAVAQADDDALVTRYVLEALRFNPHNPGVFRITTEDYTVAKGTQRATTIPKGTMLVAATQSAMFDPLKVDDPQAFRVDRPPYVYMHWGYGLHTCFGQYVNEVQIPLIVQAVLKRKNLRRAAGEAGQLRYEGRFPAGLSLEFDG